MKKFLVLIIIISIITGCNSKEKEEEVNIIPATGELLCGYKESRVDENTMYTSQYTYNFNSNGILNSVENKEIIEFQKNDKEIKKKYDKAIDEAKEEYKDIKGITTNIEKENNKYVLTITIDKDSLDKESYEKYLVNYDRVNTYKIFTSMGYTCN